MPLSLFSLQWFMCLFAKDLPLFLVLRVWDVMLWEGPSVLMRAGAAVLHCYHESVLATSDFQGMTMLLQRLGPRVGREALSHRCRRGCVALRLGPQHRLLLGRSLHPLVPSPRWRRSSGRRARGR